MISRRVGRRPNKAESCVWLYFLRREKSCCAQCDAAKRFDEALAASAEPSLFLLGMEMVSFSNGAGVSGACEGRNMPKWYLALLHRLSLQVLLESSLGFPPPFGTE